MESTHTAQLCLPLLPPAACKVHVFPRLASGSLLSIGQLCDFGCEAVFTATTVRVTLNKVLICQGHRSISSQRLWRIDTIATGSNPTSNISTESHVQPTLTTPPPTATTSLKSGRFTLRSPANAANAMIPTATTRERVAFMHAACFSPCTSTLIGAIEAGRMTGIPWLTSDLVRRHLPQSEATVRGHLDQQRKNLNSTKPKVEYPILDVEPPPAEEESKPSPTTSAEDFSDLNPKPDEPAELRSHCLYAGFAEVTGKVFSDQTGKFLMPSTSGNEYLLILYDYDSNFIHAEAMKNKSGTEIVNAYRRGHKLLTARGLKPQLQRLDNEASEALKEFMTEEHIDFQLAPPKVHRRNAAERAIRTFKNHFNASLCSTDKKFPLKLWDHLLHYSSWRKSSIR